MASNDQTDAMEKSKKAARDNIMAFDEVHQLQEDMGDAAGDMALDTPTIDGNGYAGNGLMMGGIGGMLADYRGRIASIWASGV